MQSVCKFSGCILAVMVVLGATLLTAGNLPAAPIDSTGTWQGRTKPSEESKLSLAFPGVVEKVQAKVGAAMKKGDVLIQLDTSIEQKLLDGLRMEAVSMHKIDFTKADLEVKKIQLQKKKDMGDAASPQEVQEAELAVKQSEAQIKQAEVEHGQKQAEADRQELKINQMTLRAPYDCQIQKVELSSGETADPAKPAVTVVKNDPIWIELYIPISQAQALKAGESMQVKHDKDANWSEARVLFVAPKAEADSGTQQVMLEMANPENRNSGQVVQVRRAGGVAGTN